MKATRERINQVTIVNGMRHESTHYASMQLLHQNIDFEFAYIFNVCAIEVEAFVHSYVGRFYMVMFDYVRKGHPFAIINISNSTITTDFPESFSLN